MESGHQRRCSLSDFETVGNRQLGKILISVFLYLSEKRLREFNSRNIVKHLRGMRILERQEPKHDWKINFLGSSKKCPRQLEIKDGLIYVPANAGL